MMAGSGQFLGNGKVWQLGIGLPGSHAGTRVLECRVTRHRLAPFLDFSPSSLPLTQQLSNYAPIGLGILFLVR